MSVVRQCVDRQGYIAEARRNLEEALSNALSDIRTVLNTSADFVVEQPGMYYYWDYGLQGVLFPGTTRVKEFDPILFTVHFGSGLRGNYDPNSGRIFLREGAWCRHCLIHETLHSVSIFAANIRVGDQYPFLREGLTEFMTGYVLWQQHPHCYESWKERTYPDWCALSQDYGNMARIWYTFCRFIDLEKVKKLFFGNGEQRWSTVWSSFLGEIRAAGYNFNDPLRGTRGRLQDRFLDECKRNFGRAQVERIVEMESFNFEYETLHQDACSPC